MPKKTFFNLSPQKRERIEAVAVEEFAANTLAGSSINTIVANADIAKGSFYQYFTGKEDLYKHILAVIQTRKVELAKAMPPASNNLDFFGYLRWMLQVALVFELRNPKLSKIDKIAFWEKAPHTPEDPEVGLVVGGLTYFNDLLTQGILHDDVATWVDTELASSLLGAIYHQAAPHLILRLGEQAQAIKDGTVSVFEDSLAQSLMDNLMDLLEAGMSRDPQIRKDFYSK